MRLLILSIVLVGAVCLASGGIAEEKVPSRVRGARLYGDNCARCHNLRPASELGDQEWSIVIAHMRVTAGLPGAQARDIEAFLRFANNPPLPPLEVNVSAGPPEQRRPGSELIDTYGCRGCHVIGETGGSVGPELDQVFERRDEDWIRAQIKNPRQHNPASVMPALGLVDTDVEAILEVLRPPQ